MGGKHHHISLGFTTETFPAGTHMCFIYNNEDERREVMARYLESGIQQDEYTFYLVHKVSPDEFREHMSSYGINLPKKPAPGQMDILSAADTYMPDRTFLPDRMLDTLKNAYTNGIKNGFTGARAMGEMEWALEGMPGSDRLIEYEAKINTITGEYPCTAICQYDARRFDGATLFEVLNVHPMMVVRGQVVRNPYYMPPEEYFRKKGIR